MNCLILLNFFLFSRCLIVVLFDKTRSALLFVSFLDCNAFFKINSFSCSSSISPTGFKSDTLTNSDIKSEEINNKLEIYIKDILLPVYKDIKENIKFNKFYNIKETITFEEIYDDLFDNLMNQIKKSI